MSDLKLNDYLFCIYDGNGSPGNFVVDIVPRRVWEVMGHPDGDGVPGHVMESISIQTGWYIAEKTEGTLEVSHATLRERILGGFPLMDFKPIPREEVRAGLEKIGMTWSQDLFDYVIRVSD